MVGSEDSNDSSFDACENALLLNDKQRSSPEDNSIPVDYERIPCRNARRSSFLTPIWLHVIIITVYTAVFLTALAFFVPRQGKPLLGHHERLDRSSPLHPAFRYSRRYVDYNFDSETAFNGPPLEAVDEAWLNLLNQPHELLLSEETVAASNISTVQVADGSGRYMVQPQVYHMLHCLFNIYKFTHADFYGEDPEGPEWVKKHTDHCIDNLRQFVQCHAGGSGVATYKWLSRKKTPWPVLSAEEICVDWDFFDDWVQRNSVPMEDLVHMKDKHLLEHPTKGVLAYEDFK